MLDFEAANFDVFKSLSAHLITNAGFLVTVFVTNCQQLSPNITKYRELVTVFVD